MFFKVVWFDSEPCAVTEAYPHSEWFNPNEEPGDGDYLTSVQWFEATKENYRKLANLFADYR